LDHTIVLIRMFDHQEAPKRKNPNQIHAIFDPVPPKELNLKKKSHKQLSTSKYFFPSFYQLFL